MFVNYIVEFAVRMQNGIHFNRLNVWVCMCSECMFRHVHKRAAISFRAPGPAAPHLIIIEKLSAFDAVATVLTHCTHIYE